jgi:hypothetical protein
MAVEKQPSPGQGPEGDPGEEDILHEGFYVSYIKVAAHALLRVREMARDAGDAAKRELEDGVSELIDCIHWKIDHLEDDTARYQAFLARVLPEDENPVVREIGGNMLEAHHQNLIANGFTDTDPLVEANRWAEWFDREPNDYVRLTVYDHATGIAEDIDGDVPQWVLDFAEAIDEAFSDRPRPPRASL